MLSVCVCLLTNRSTNKPWSHTNYVRLIYTVNKYMGWLFFCKFIKSMHSNATQHSVGNYVGNQPISWPVLVNPIGQQPHYNTQLNAVKLRPAVQWACFTSSNQETDRSNSPDAGTCRSGRLRRDGSTYLSWVNKHNIYDLELWPWHLVYLNLS